LDEAESGFWLKAEEVQPLQQRLGEIASSINDALPSFLALTNQLASVLTGLTNVTARVGGTLPEVDGAVKELKLALADVRPALQKPGGIGELLFPTNLESQLTLTLSNLNPGVGPIAITLSNLNARVGEVGVALSNVNLQLSANTNLLADANQLTRSVSSLAETLETLFRRHWLFRSAFRTNRPPESRSSGDRPINPPRDLRRF
jgi:ABC-type transporter Mla subunit MlaD